MSKETQRTAVFGGGCFWCTEATFEMLKGVHSVIPGYAGGSSLNPTYEAVCGGTTGHAEVIKIEFDPGVITYEDLLTVFFSVHDPTTPNRQGNDVGTQYRSIILYTNEEQKQQAEQFIQKLQNKEFTGRLIVTEVRPLEHFYEAENYHHHYFKNNPEKAYCQLVIDPKVTKLKKRFGELVK